MFNSHVRLVHCMPRGWPSPRAWGSGALAEDPWSNGASFFVQVTFKDLTKKGNAKQISKYSR